MISAPGIGSVTLTAAGSPTTAGSAAARPTATPAQRAKIGKTAQAFEASFLTSMLGQMFQGVETAAPFGGGQGEAAFRSFLTESIGKAMVSHGGIGLSKVVTQEMLKMQGLS